MEELKEFFLRNFLLLILLIGSLLAHVSLGFFSRPKRIDPQLAERPRGRTSVSVHMVKAKPVEQRRTTTPTPPAPVSLSDLPPTTVPLEEAPIESLQRRTVSLEASQIVRTETESDAPPAPVYVPAAAAQRKNFEPERAPPVEQPPTPAKLARRMEHTPPLAADAKVEAVQVTTHRPAASQQSSGADVPPRFLTRPDPIYPRELLLAGAEGRVELLVQVAANGMPTSVRVHRSSGYRAMDQSAADAVRRWRFAPARRGSAAVEAQVIVPIDFRIRR